MTEPQDQGARGEGGNQRKGTKGMLPEEEKARLSRSLVRTGERDSFDRFKGKAPEPETQETVMVTQKGHREARGSQALHSFRMLRCSGVIKAGCDAAG